MGSFSSPHVSEIGFDIGTARRVALVVKLLELRTGMLSELMVALFVEAKMLVVSNPEPCTRNMESWELKSRNCV
jgi:hypothetical protein